MQAPTITLKERVWACTAGYEVSEALICIVYVPICALVVGFTVIYLVEAFIVMNEYIVGDNT